MISINRAQWYEDLFATVLTQQDLIRQPLLNYPELSNKEKDQLRQTQVFKDELVQILGVHQEFSLVRKYEATLGWILSKNLQPSDLKNFKAPNFAPQSASEFLSTWKGTIYEFGGLSKDGIDCSGFSQLFYLHVHGLIIPKNSRDQRKLGASSSFQEQKDNDLVFCFPKDEPESHHVAIFSSGKLWHSRRKGGVVCQNAEEFLSEFNVSEVRSILKF